MKRITAFTISLIGTFLLLTGCSEVLDEPLVNSGSLDDEYVGDANPILEEIFKQTEEEAQIQADILKKMEEDDSDGSDGLSHF
ncbi:hypothetical protein [Bacillus sp. B15-48]|uniref:hypothetical protein n=1 Tax=Bacillus sp. B15-48 TaxID=1548601 RepID=UPI00193F6F7C|nr:hypothetical protein [Bacillus sp. B15-48]MBM4765257.1 hypothetical protein [Bacillus sp. B15-48]